MFSLCGTTYNNVKTAGRCLDSLIKAFNGLNFEIVIVDNFSTDGTFKLLMNYAKSHDNVRVYRYKCSRGLGRQLAFKKSKGRYIIPIDLDGVYDSRKIRLLIKGYLTSGFKDKKCLFYYILPRQLLEEVGGWRDLNRSEDIDLLTRLYLKDLAVSLPITGLMKFHEKTIYRQYIFLPSDWHREKRYIRSPRQIFPRLFRNKRDMACGSAYNVRKIVLTYRYIYSRNLFFVFLSCLYHLLFRVINELTGLKPVSADPNLSNYSYIQYKNIITAVNPLELGLTPQDVTFYDINDPHIKLIAQYHAEVIYALKKIQAWIREKKI